MILDQICRESSRNLPTLAQSNPDHGLQFLPYWVRDHYKAEVIISHLVGVLDHFWFFHILGIIIPTDIHIFQRGRYTTNQISHSLFTWLLFEEYPRGRFVLCFSLKLSSPETPDSGTAQILPLHHQSTDIPWIYCLLQVVSHEFPADLLRLWHWFTFFLILFQRKFAIDSWKSPVVSDLFTIEYHWFTSVVIDFFHSFPSDLPSRSSRCFLRTMV